MDTVLVDSNDHDPVFGISDGTSFVGFNVMHKGKYGDHTPFLYIEGDMVNMILSNQDHDIIGTKVSSRRFPSEITIIIQIKPNDQWGSCHTEHEKDLLT